MEECEQMHNFLFIQIIQITFIEICLNSRLNTVDLIPKIDTIQILFQDRLLIIRKRKKNRQNSLSDFLDDSTRSCGEVGIFYPLFCQRTGSTRHSS